MEWSEDIIKHGCYILHFDESIGRHNYGDERHYVGSAHNMRSRIRQHLLGFGSEVTRKAIAAGNSPSAITIIAKENSTAVESMIIAAGASRFCHACQLLRDERVGGATNVDH